MPSTVVYTHEVSGAVIPLADLLEINLALRFTADDFVLTRSKTYHFTKGEAAAKRALIQTFVNEVQAKLVALDSSLRS